MRRASLEAYLLCILCGMWSWVAPAHADIYSSTDTTFDVTGQFASGSTLSGTLTLNSGSQFNSNIALFTAADLNVSGPDNLQLNDIVSQLIFQPGIYDIQVGAPNYGPNNPQSATLFLSIPSSIVNSQQFSTYSGGPIIPTIGNGNNSAAYLFNSNGSFSKSDLLTSGSVESASSSCATALSGPGSIFRLLPGGAKSQSGISTAMTGVFIPGGGLTLAAAANACGYSSFNWQQEIIGVSENEPIVDGKGNILPHPTPDKPISDPPANGWSHEGCNAAPYYYSIGPVQSILGPTIDCSRYNVENHEYSSGEITSDFPMGISSDNLCKPNTQGPVGGTDLADATMLTFCDTPNNSYQGDSKEFATTLVGVSGDTAYPLEAPVYWMSNTYGGQVTDSGFTAEGGGVNPSLYESAFNIDVSNATGGVTLLSGNGTPIPEPPSLIIILPTVLTFYYLSAKSNSSLARKARKHADLPNAASKSISCCRL